MSDRKTIEYYDWLGKDGMHHAACEVGVADDFVTVSAMLKPTDRVLDLACGYGRLTVHMAEIALEACGLDSSPVLIAEAKKHTMHNLSYVLADMRTLPFTSAYFDKVFCFWNGFNHLLTEQDQIQCLQEIARVLKPGGFAFLVLPDVCTVPWNSMLETAVAGVVTWTRSSGNGTAIEVQSYVHTEDTIEKIVNKSDFHVTTEKCNMNNGIRMVVSLTRL